MRQTLSETAAFRGMITSQQHCVQMTNKQVNKFTLKPNQLLLNSNRTRWSGSVYQESIPHACVLSVT